MTVMHIGDVVHGRDIQHAGALYHPGDESRGREYLTPPLLKASESIILSLTCRIGTIPWLLGALTHLTLPLQSSRSRSNWKWSHTKQPGFPTKNFDSLSSHAAMVKKQVPVACIHVAVSPRSNPQRALLLLSRHRQKTPANHRAPQR